MKKNRILEKRQKLYTGHGHTTVLTEDMVCPICGIDFKNAPISKIILALEERSCSLK